MSVEMKLGRPRKKIDEKKLVELIGKGFTVQFVADFLGVAESTIYRDYSELLRKGYAFRNGCLQARQFQNAMSKNNTTMQIWLGKQWLDQTDRESLEVSGYIEHGHFDAGKLSDEQLSEAERLIESAYAGRDSG